jgi:hypothetical protein
MQIKSTRRGNASFLGIQQVNISIHKGIQGVNTAVEKLWGRERERKNY